MVIELLMREQFKGRDKLIAANLQALSLGHGWVGKNLDSPIGLKLRHADTIGDRIFIDGNSAAALGCVRRCDGLRLVSYHAVITLGGSLRPLLQPDADR